MTEVWKKVRRTAKRGYRLANNEGRMAWNTYKNVRDAKGPLNRALAGYRGAKQIVGSFQNRKKKKNNKRKGKGVKMNPVAISQLSFQQAVKKARRENNLSRKPSEFNYVNSRESSQRFNGTKGFSGIRRSVDGKSCVVSHTELISTAYATGNVLTPQFFPLSPCTQLTPFAAGIALNYQKVRIRSLSIAYEGTSGTSQEGMIWMACEFNTDIDKEAYRKDLKAISTNANKPIDGGCPLWSSAGFSVHVNSFANGTQGKLQCFAGDPATIKDDQSNFFGGWFIYIVDAQDNGAKGNIWAQYEMEFTESNLNPIPYDTYIARTGLNLSSNALNTIMAPTNLINTSRSALSTMVYETIDPGPPNDYVIQFADSCTVQASVTWYGTGFNDPSNSAVTADNMPYDINLSDGSTFVLESGTTNDNRQTFSGTFSMLRDGYFYFSQNPGFISTINGAQIVLIKCSPNLSVDAPIATPGPLTTIKSNVSAALMSKAHAHFKATGRCMKLSGPSKINKSSTYWYIDCNKEEETKYEAQTSDEENEDATPGYKIRGEILNENKDDDLNSNASKNSKKFWVNPLTTNKGNHISNGNIYFYLFLIIVTVAQQPPYRTTTRNPTPPPNTKYPSNQPTTQTPTSVPTNWPSKKPTHYLPPFSYSMVRFSGPSAAPYTNYKETSTFPLVYKFDDSRLQLNESVDLPRNITINLLMNTGSTGLASFAGSDAVFDWGQNCVAAGLQTGVYYGKISVSGDRMIELTPAPSSSPTVSGWVYVAMMEKVPVTTHTLYLNNTVLVY